MILFPIIVPIRDCNAKLPACLPAYFFFRNNTYAPTKKDS